MNRLGAFVAVAYTDGTSREARALLEGLMALVLLSVVTTVLERDSALEAHYGALLQVVEAGVLALFVADYMLSLRYAPRKRAYVLSFAGLVDLAAIVPAVALIGQLTAIKFLRGLRLLRLLRALRATTVAQRHRASLAGLADGESGSLFLGLELAVILTCLPLLLVPEETLRRALLGFVLAAGGSVALRRWLVSCQHGALAVLVLLGSILGAVLWALRLDFQGQTGAAAGLILATVALAVVSWVRTEAPAGAL